MALYHRFPSRSKPYTMPLRPSRAPSAARRGDHGVHNARDHDRLAEEIARGRRMLLHERGLLRRHVQAQVAAREHDAVCGRRDRLEGRQRLPVLHLHARPAARSSVLIQL